MIAANVKVTLSALLLCAVGLSSGCEGDPVFFAENRDPADRRPLVRECNPLDESTCLAPWPSNLFASAAPTETGLRLREVDLSEVSADDRAEATGYANGFSRVTPVVCAVPLEEPDVTLRLFLAQHDHDARGEEIALTVDVFEDRNERALAGFPRGQLEANADHLFVATSTSPNPPRGVSVALGLVPIASQDDAELYAYHAPARQALRDFGVPAESVTRFSWFTTRTAEDPLFVLDTMLAHALRAVSAGDLSVTITDVAQIDDPISDAPATVVSGTLDGIPEFVLTETPEGQVATDLDGIDPASLLTRRVAPIGSRSAPFRVVIPPGEGDYRFAMYGHGLGGDQTDASFDAFFIEERIAKVGTRVIGFTGDDVVESAATLRNPIRGSHLAMSRFAQAIVDARSIEAAMATVLGDALSAPELMGAPNPNATRRPINRDVVWIGGSLGGTLGLTYALSSEKMTSAVLNVPGAGFTHWLTKSSVFALVRGVVLARLSEVEIGVMLAASQTVWDAVDGIAWSHRRGDDVYLVQMSIGDTILPNAGSDMVAIAADARYVGEVLREIPGLRSVEVAEGQSGLTQYLVDGDGLDKHGFGASRDPAGVAARDQIRAFVRSVYDGAPRISVPDGCEAMSCDFTG